MDSRLRGMTAERKDYKMSQADIGLIGLAVMARTDFEYGEQGIYRRLFQQDRFEGR